MLRARMETPHMKSAALAFIFGISILAAPAAADVRNACRQDKESFCKSVEKGGGRIAKCMAEHRAQLSQGCKLALADRMLERRAERGDRPHGQGDGRGDRPGERR